MSDRAVGWMFVAIQACLLAGLVLLPSADHWPTPIGIDWLGFGLVAVGLAIAAIAALDLGDALTATPVPTRSASLTTTGLYHFVRHPIYTGVLAAVTGWTLRSGNVFTAALAVVTIVFFTAKSGWEEKRLRQRYANYETFAAETPRFVPRIRR